MAENKVVYNNNTSKLLYPSVQHFWSGTPLTIPGRLPPGSTILGQQQAIANGSLKFANVYVDSEENLPTTRKFISAFDISAPQAYGPYGSDSPQNYSWTLGLDETIKEIIVRHGFIVDAIGFVVADKSGTTSTTIFGGSSGTETKIPLKSDEFITHVSGTYGKYAHSGSNASVATLRIHTNLVPAGYGPYGRGQLVQNPLNFSSAVGSSPVVGFFGSYTGYLDSIGVFLSSTASSKAYAECGPYGPIDWNVVEVKLGLSKSSDEYVDHILGGRVKATVLNNGDATVDISDS